MFQLSLKAQMHQLKSTLIRSMCHKRRVSALVPPNRPQTHRCGIPLSPRPLRKMENQKRKDIHLLRVTAGMPSRHEDFCLSRQVNEQLHEV